MKNNQRKSKGPKDAVTSLGPNAEPVRAIASEADYAKSVYQRKEKSGESADDRFFAHSARARTRAMWADSRYDYGKVAFRASAGRIWAYRGKRARVLTMLTQMPQGVTQWDTLPWHTRLGGTIHALRRDGLEISTELEGEYRHARYRLCTPGRLLIQGENSDGAAKGTEP